MSQAGAYQYLLGTESGRQVYYLTDEAGNQKYHEMDASGHLVYQTVIIPGGVDASGNPIETEVRAPIYTTAPDDNDQKVWETGDTLPRVKQTTTDEAAPGAEAAYVLDEAGNKLPIYTTQRAEAQAGGVYEVQPQVVYTLSSGAPAPLTLPVHSGGINDSATLSCRYLTMVNGRYQIREAVLSFIWDETTGAYVQSSGDAFRVTRAEAYRLDEQGRKLKVYQLDGNGSKIPVYDLDKPIYMYMNDEKIPVYALDENGHMVEDRKTSLFYWQITILDRGNSLFIEGDSRGTTYRVKESTVPKAQAEGVAIAGNGWRITDKLFVDANGLIVQFGVDGTGEVIRKYERGNESYTVQYQEISLKEGAQVRTSVQPLLIKAALTAAHVTAAGSEITAETAGDAILGTVYLKDTTLKSVARQNFTSGSLTGRGADIIFISGGEVQLAVVDLMGGSLEAQTLANGGYIRLELLEALKTQVTLSALGGGIYTQNETGYLWFRDEAADRNETLTLQARDDIGSKARPILLDTSEAVVIPVVGSYYLSGRQLTGEALKRKIAPIPQGSGRNENGQTVSGDYLGEAGRQNLYGALAAQTGTELAALVAARLSREAWTDKLMTQDAAAALIAGGIIDRAALSELLAGAGLLDQPTLDTLLTTPDGIRRAAQMLLPRLTAQHPAQDPIAPAYDVTHEQLNGWLAQAIDSGAADPLALAQLLAGLLTQAEIQGLMERSWTTVDYGAYPAYQDAQARRLILQVGQASGAAFVTNEGTIEIIQQTGTLTAGAVRSQRGDVLLTAVNGSIQGLAEENTNLQGRSLNLKASQGVGDQTPLKTEQRPSLPTLAANPAAPAAGSAGLTPVMIVRHILADGTAQWALMAQASFDWLRVAYPEMAGSLTALSGGDIAVTELTGDMGLASIRTPGSVVLAAPGSLIHVGSDTQSVLQIGGNAQLTSLRGGIGQDGKYLTTQVDGEIIARARHNISIQDTGDLKLTADSSQGQVNAGAQGDLELKNTAGSLVIGPITAGRNAVIQAAGQLLAGRRLGSNAQITAQSILLASGKGDVGSLTAPLLIDTRGGAFSAQVPVSLYAREISGDLIAGSVTAGEHIQVWAPGSIQDEGKGAPLSTAADAAIALKEAQDAVIRKNDVVIRADQAAALAVQEAQLALAALEEARKALKADPANPWLQAAADTAQAFYDEKQLAADTAQAASQAAAQALQAASQAVQAAQQAYDSLLARAEKPALKAGQNLGLNAGDSIGQAGNPLTIAAGGIVSAGAGDKAHIYLEGIGDITFTTLEADRVSVEGTGMLSGSHSNSGFDVIAGELVIRSFGADVGEAGDSLETWIDQLTALGENIYLRNGKGLTVRQLVATQSLGGEIRLKVKGGLYAGDSELSPRHIYADHLTLWSDRNVGTAEAPLNVILGPGGSFLLHLNAGRKYYVTGVQPKVKWHNVLPWMIDSLPQPDFNILAGRGGIGKPQAMNLTRYHGQFEKWLRTIQDIWGYLDRTILSVYPKLGQPRMDKVELLYTALNQVLRPQGLYLLNFNTGTTLILGRQDNALRLETEVLANLPEIQGVALFTACRVWLRDETGHEQSGEAGMTLTFRILAAGNRLVTVWHKAGGDRWEPLQVQANEKGGITLAVDTLGDFAFSLAVDQQKL